MADEKAVRDLIRLIYECSADPRQWPQFLAAFAKAVQAHAAGMVVQDMHNRHGNVAAGHGFDPFWERRYAEYYGSLNVWLDRGRHLMQAGNVVSSEVVVRDSEIERTEFYHDFLRPQGHFHSFGGIMTSEDSVSSFITALRAKQVGHFQETEQTLLRELMPHLQTALRLHHRISGLETRLDSASAALDYLPRALIVTDAAGRILYMNRRAEEALKSDSGLWAAPDGLRTCSARQTARLREFIALTAGTAEGNGRHPGGVTEVRRPGALPLKLEIAPLCSSSNGRKRQPSVAIFLAEPDAASSPDAARLAALLDLTPAESRLTAALVSGKTVQEFAEESRVTMNTARTLLKRVFTKTGVSRQAELVRLALTYAGGLH